MKRSHLLAGVSPSFVSWRLCLKKIYFKHIKNRSSSNLLLFQSFLVHLCKDLYVPVICFGICFNEVHWKSGKSSQSTNWVVNEVKEFSRSVEFIQIQDLMKLFWWLSVEQLSLTRSGSKQWSWQLTVDSHVDSEVTNECQLCKFFKTVFFGKGVLGS